MDGRDEEKEVSFWAQYHPEKKKKNIKNNSHDRCRPFSHSKTMVFSIMRGSGCIDVPCHPPLLMRPLYVIRMTPQYAFMMVFHV